MFGRKEEGCAECKKENFLGGPQLDIRGRLSKESGERVKKRWWGVSHARCSLCRVQNKLNEVNGIYVLFEMNPTMRRRSGTPIRRSEGGKGACNAGKYVIGESSLKMLQPISI